MLPPRHVLIDDLQETLSLVPDEHLPFVQETALLFSELLPPWDNKVSFIEPIESLLSRSMAFNRIVEDQFYSATTLFDPNIE